MSLKDTEIQWMKVKLAEKTSVDDTASDSIDSTYSASKIEERISGLGGMRGVAVFVSATEPTDKEINDIWIQI